MIKVLIVKIDREDPYCKLGSLFFLYEVRKSYARIAAIYFELIRYPPLIKTNKPLSSLDDKTTICNKIIYVN